MNYKKILGALMAFCIVAVPFADYSTPLSYQTFAAVEEINSGTINLDNEHPGASANLQNVEVLAWNTSDKNVAVVDQNGNITAKGKGTCVITAVCSDKIYRLTVISEYEEKESDSPVYEMGDIMFTNEITESQINFNAPEGTAITYSSSDESVATVDEKGLVKAKGMGRCEIYALIDNAKYIFKVTSVYTGITTGEVEIGEIELTADNPMQVLGISSVSDASDIKWSSSDEKIAVVSQNGVVSGVKKGSCKVYAETEEKTYIINIIVSFDIEDIIQTFEINGIGNSINLSFSSMTSDVKYSSTDESVATVDENAKVTAVGKGSAIIEAKSKGGISWVRVEVVDVVGLGIVGDANLDGKVNMADATFIVQHVGNKDKYKITKQGEINADVDGKAGLTGTDALIIQQYIAKIIDSIPIKSES